MCGVSLRICLGLNATQAAHPAHLIEQVQESLYRRGPDWIGSHEVTACGAVLQLVASLLQLRGHRPPHTWPLRDDASGCCLLFNGELFGGGVHVAPDQNDGEQLLTALVNASATDPSNGVPSVLNSLRGPWAVIFWQPATHTVWFARDLLGRRSLLAQWPSPGQPTVTLTSVAPADLLMANGSRGSEHQACDTTQGPAGGRANAEGEGEEAAVPSAFGPAAGVHGAWQEVPPGIYRLVLDSSSSNSSSTLLYSSSSVSSNLDGVAPSWQLWHHSWQDPDLRLLTTYERPSHLIQPDDSSDTGAGAGGECGGRGELTVAASLQREAAREALGSQVHMPSARGPDADAVASVLSALRAAVEVRCRCINGAPPYKPHDTSSTAPSPSRSPPLPDAPSPAPVLILFSGGVDSTLLAALAHQSLPDHVPIDLANVCFDGGKSPDRRAAHDALAELSTYAPGRAWRMVEVDATLADVDVARDRILSLLHPAGTIMDLNIGAALWLSAGARGTLRLPAHTSVDSKAGCHGAGGKEAEGADMHLPLEQRAANEGLTDGHPYVSAARVVLLGHGADEQCAGYGRHRTRFVSGGWEALARELALDMRRIWLRNLGRDDRLVADWGREARHPFLDESFMATLLCATHLRNIADLRGPPGVGDKHVLRAALASLGLPRAAARVKRAIQFGSRIGKYSNVREFGSNRAANKRAAGSVALAELAISVPTGGGR